MSVCDVCDVWNSLEHIRWLCVCYGYSSKGELNCEQEFFCRLESPLIAPPLTRLELSQKNCVYNGFSFLRATATHKDKILHMFFRLISWRAYSRQKPHIDSNIFYLISREL